MEQNLIDRTTSRRGLGGAVCAAYGVAAYVVALVTLDAAIAFVENADLHLGPLHVTPFTLSDAHPATTLSSTSAAAAAVDVALLTLFAVQHSVMARGAFKRWLAARLPASLERSTYLWASSACLGALVVGWQPIGGDLWKVEGPLRAVLIGASLAGWGLAFASTFLLDHLQFWGLRQVFAALRRQQPPPMRFRTPTLYRMVRHPIYLGFLIAFWVTPWMSVGHLLFAAGATGYIFVGAHLEERDLVRAFGEDYRSYRTRVPMIVPRARRGA